MGSPLKKAALVVLAIACCVATSGSQTPTPTPDCADDSWTATSTTNAPTARDHHTSVWTGREMIVWGGGQFGSIPFNTGARYNPGTDSWTATSATTGRHSHHTAVWTGTEMIVWGGDTGSSYSNTGGRYNPLTNEWTATSTTNAPTPRYDQKAIWTGSEMIVWGGVNSTVRNTGGRYNPGTDSWVATSTTNAPTARQRFTTIWTGTEMIVWGGMDFDGYYFNTGGRYNPATDTWTATSITNAPTARNSQTVVWTGSEMIVWGGYDNFGFSNTGGRYHPGTDSWSATSTTNVPAARTLHAAVWTGSEMIVWGGYDSSINHLSTGGRYDPRTNSWTATSITNAPAGREDPTAVWTGTALIVWGGSLGGFPGSTFFNTGGRYCAQPPPTPTPFPIPGTFNAVDAQIFVAPMVTQASPTPNGSIVQHFQNTIPATTGYAIFNVHVNTTGYYWLKGKVNWLDGGSNSMFVKFGSQPSGTDVWTGALTFGFEDRYFRDPPGFTTPHVFSLNAGDTTLHIGGREADAFLSTVTVETAVPTSTLGNYPDISIPLSTDTTVTPNISPTNATSIDVSTSTHFKGRLEGDPMTGVVRVTDAHPAGTHMVTLKAFDSGGVPATKTFTLTVTTPATCNPVSFAPAANFGTGEEPLSVAVGDFNGDGKQDLATADSHSASVSILLGDGAGNFGAATNFGAGTNPVLVAVGDFNGDGKQDLAVLRVSASGSVAILLGDGAGNFSAPTDFGVGAYPRSVAVGDFNGDGKQDLAVANAGSNNVSILLGNGAGSFSVATNFSADADGRPSSVAVGDFDRDGKQDLAVANGASSNVSILLGDGAGNFSAPTNFGVGTSTFSVAVGDFNGDGQQDLATADFYSASVSILLGDGAGNFSAATNFGAGANPNSVAVGDFNGDGKQDLAVALTSPLNNVSILLGDGAGNFNAATNFGAGANPYSVAVGDFNGDGKQDLAVTNERSSNVSILLRNCVATTTPTPPPISISGSVPYCSNPIHGPVAGVTLTLTGTGLGSTLSNDSGNYTFPSLPSGGTYTVTPSKAALAPGSAGIDTLDVVAVQRHFLSIALIPPGCALLAADVNGDASVNTADIIAIQRFYIGRISGTANVGKYQFTPASRMYTSVVDDQAAQDFDTLIFGDVASGFVHGPETPPAPGGVTQAGKRKLSQRSAEGEAR